MGLSEFLTKERYSDTHNIVEIKKNNEALVRCRECKDIFSTYMSHIERGYTMFCSRDCHNEYRYYKDIDLSDRETMAYIGGVYIGDGSITKQKNGYHFYLDVSDKIFRDKVNEELKSLGCNTHLSDRHERGKKKMYRVRVTCRPLYEYLDSSFSKESGLVNNFNLNSIEEKKLFICGFYESEGHYNEDKGKQAASMSQSNRDILFSIKHMLEEIDIKSSITGPSSNGGYKLNILGGISYRRRFFRDIDPIIRNPLRKGELKDSGLTKMVERYV